MLQPMWEHGYDWEHWALQPAGMWHTVYIGDFACDYPPHWAWLQSFPMWVTGPFVVLWAILFMVVFQNIGSIGIKPKRYTPEWLIANRERERQENTNPITRYLDRRREERGGVWIAQYNLPWHPYWMWMSSSHDKDYPQYKSAAPVHPHLRYTDSVLVLS